MKAMWVGMTLIAAAAAGCGEGRAIFNIDVYSFLKGTGDDSIAYFVPPGPLPDSASSTPRLLAFGPERARRVGIVTGAAGSLIGQAAAAGLDTYITGEGPHQSFFDAEELGLNVFYAGHYATETVGVKALAEHLRTRFGLPWTFLDHPTGL